MATIGTSSAIAAAVADAVGVWVLDLPLTSEKVSGALKNKREG